MSDIYHLIDRLERILADSMRAPLSAYLFINEDDFLDVIDQMRTAIPQQIREGERLQRERERIVDQAGEEATRVVQLAREEASDLIANHELTQEAEAQAQEIRARARQEAEILKAEANDYARGVLRSLDDQLDSVEEQIANLLVTVRNGLNTLNQGNEPAPEDPARIPEE